jgi:hypothetical protein
MSTAVLTNSLGPDRIPRHFSVRMEGQPPPAVQRPSRIGPLCRNAIAAAVKRTPRVVSS